MKLIQESSENHPSFPSLSKGGDEGEVNIFLAFEKKSLN